MNKILLFSLFLMLTASCSFAPKYSRPMSPVPDQFPTATDSTETQVQASDLERDSFEFFPDENLRNILELALKENRDLKLASLRVERSQALYGIQRKEKYPTVNGTLAGSKQGLSRDLISPTDSRTREQYSLDIGTVSWELDFFGRIRNLSEQALQEYLATEEAQRGVKILLFTEVSQAYLNLASDREILQLTQATLKAQDESFRLAEKRYNAGLSSELDLSRAKIPVEMARRDVARYQQLVAQDRNTLDLLCGTKVPDAWLPMDLNQVQPPIAIASGLDSQVLLRRPDIMAAEHHLKGAYAFIGAARASIFPRISLTSSVGTASNELDGLFGGGSYTWSFIPKLVIPIFDSRARAAVKVSEADQKIALAQYEKAIQTAFKEVADTLAVQNNIEEQIDAQMGLVDASQRTYDLAQKRFKSGVDSYLGVLDAQRSLFASQQQLIGLRLVKLANRVRMFAVLGGGQEPLPEFDEAKTKQNQENGGDSQP